MFMFTAMNLVERICVEYVPYIVEKYPQWSRGKVSVVQFVVRTITPEMKWKLMSSHRACGSFCMFDFSDPDAAAKIFIASLEWESYAQRNLWDLWIFYSSLNDDGPDSSLFIKNFSRTLTDSLNPHVHFEALSGLVAVYRNQHPTTVVVQSLMGFSLPNFQSLLTTICWNWLRRKEDRFRMELISSLESSFTVSTESDRRWILLLFLFLLSRCTIAQLNAYFSTSASLLQSLAKHYQSMSTVGASEFLPLLSQVQQKLQRYLHHDPRKIVDSRPFKKQKMDV